MKNDKLQELFEKFKDLTPEEKKQKMKEFVFPFRKKEKK